MAALVLNGDTSGTITLAAPAVAGSTTLTLPAVSGIILSTGNPPDAFSTATGLAPSYSARAWVNWQGTGTVTIRGSGNVSSITDGGTGQYTINFTVAMADTNYACLSACGSVSGANGGTLQTSQIGGTVVAPTTTSQYVAAATDQGNLYDTQFASVAIFR